MKISIGKNVLEVFIDSDDDFYILYLLLDKGDLIYGWTVRTLRAGKNEKGDRVKIYIGLRVEDMEYHAFRDTLRVRGIVIEAPEWTSGVKGSYHTMELIKGGTYRIVKTEKINTQFLSRIIETFSKGSVKILLVSISDDELAVAIMRKYGLEIITTIENPYSSEKSISKIASKYEQLRKFVNEALSRVKHIIKTYSIDYAIILGPSIVLDIVKDIVVNELERLKVSKYSIVSTFEGGLAGIYEFQNTKIDIIRDIAELYGIDIINEVYSRLSKEVNTVALGLEEVEKALDQGAVDQLIILDTEYKELGEKARQLVMKAIDINAKVTIMPSTSNIGEKVKGLGGVLALLRYSMQ